MGDDALRVVVPGEGPRHWHVTLLVAGPAVDLAVLRDGLERLAHEQPFLLSVRYTADRVEVRYWEEASCLDDAAALALRLWGEHRQSAGLPCWEVVGLEVVDRDTYQWRVGQRTGGPMLTTAGGIRPF